MARFDRVVPPGEEGEIIAVMETDKYNGAIAKSVLVSTNDPVRPQVTLQLKANIRSWVEVLPNWHAVFNANHKETSRQVLYIQNRELNIGFEIIGVVSNNQFVKASVEKIGPQDPDQGKGDFRLLLDLTAEAPLGPVQGEVVVTTTSRHQKVLRIPIAGKVNGPVLFFPTMVVMFSDDSGRPARLGGTIVLQARPDAPAFRVTKAEADDPRLTLVPGPADEGRSVRIGVAWTDPEAKGLHEGKIRVAISNPEMPEIEVPYQVRIQ